MHILEVIIIMWDKDDRDLEFPDPMPVVGISYSKKGYCMVQVMESMKTFCKEDALTEEALLTKLRTCDYHQLFLHNSLKNIPFGNFNWREFGKAGPWKAKSIGKNNFKWIEWNMADEILIKVKELYGLDDKVTFRNINIPSENRPHPLHLQTALEIGAIPKKGVPFLLDILLPSDCTRLPSMYVRNLLLHPPPYSTAQTIQEICKLMSNVTCTIPHLTCISSSKLVKLVELMEVNHVEFFKIKSVVDEIFQLYSNSELNEILRLLMDPNSLATGLKMDLETIVNECESVSGRIGSYFRYHGSGGKNTKTVVLELRQLCAELQEKTNVLIYASMLLIIAKALFAHVSEGERKGWAFPTLIQPYGSSEEKGQMINGLNITGLLPHWFDPAKKGRSAVKNTVDLKSMFLLTGPNCSGKAWLIRSVCATSLFGLCGLTVPAESAIIPQFDFIMLHMNTSVSFENELTQFEIEMSELATIVNRATSKSLVLVDSICATTPKRSVGTCLAAVILEHFDSIGCLGIVSTYFHDLLKIPLILNNTVYKAMGIEYVNGRKRASYKLIDGTSTESLIFEIAESEEGVRKY